MKMEWLKEVLKEYNILVEYDNIDDSRNKEEVHGLKIRDNNLCIFCGKAYSKWR